MQPSSLQRRAMINRSRAPMQQLVENRTVYAAHQAELSIYDTFAKADRVRLDADEILYCGMISGRKIMHAKNAYDTPFLPHESFVLAPGESVEIDFPDATEEAPTSCLTLGISRDRLIQACDRLNQQAKNPHLLEEWTPDRGQVLHLFHTEATQRLLVRIVDSFLGEDTDKDLVLDLGVTELLNRMLRQQGREFLLQCAQQNPTLSGITACMHYIEEHLGEAIEVDELCQLACMSRSKFYQQFRLLFDCSPMEYLQQRRLERAKEMIASGKSITAVCYEVGYLNPSHFTRRFHQQYGMSPREYQLQQRAIS